MSGTLPPVRDELRGVVPYGAPQLDVPVRLNTNETPVPPPPGFLATFAERLMELELNRYPDRDAVALRTALGAREGLGAERVWAANGSNEVIFQLLLAYGGVGRSALLFHPSYSMYAELCRNSSTSAHTVDLGLEGRLTLEHVEGPVHDVVAAHAPSLTLFANPNNPTGALVGHDVIRALHDTVTGWVVIDEAYVEFAPDGTSARALLEELPRLIVSRTFSKAFRLAGLRLGYLLGPLGLVPELQKVRLPYHLDSLTQLAGLVAIEQESVFLEHRALTRSECTRVHDRLAEMAGVEPLPSAGNFVLFTSPLEDGFDRLLSQGVLVRDFSSAVGHPGTLRVSIGTPEENDAFLAALTRVLEG
jgi:histidinol-phosphate aminotransferase